MQDRCVLIGSELVRVVLEALTQPKSSAIN